MDIKKANEYGIVNCDETDIMFETLFFGDILYLHKNFEDMINDIKIATELDSRKAFLNGLIDRLQYLGKTFHESDAEEILNELKGRYKSRMGIAVPRTVKEWVRGTTPGTTNRRNNYELCYALEMDVNETASFFIKNYMSIPFNYKDSTDAVFFYCFLNNKSYDVISAMLEKATHFIPNKEIETETISIGRNIAEIDDDDEFISYISKHCYNNEQQYQVARNTINRLVQEIKGTLGDVSNEDRVINKIIDNVFGFCYQQNIQKNVKSRCSKTKFVRDNKLPRRFVESLPRSGVLSDILKGKKETYETLRKTMIILYFYIFFFELINENEEDIRNNALDFYEEINTVLFDCGFSQIYMRHPFDYLIVFCAMSPDPLETFWELNLMRYKEV